MRIGIFHPAAIHHPLGDLPAIFTAWQVAQPVALPTDAPSFHTLIGAAANQTLRAAGSCAPTALLLATTKGDIDAEVAWLRSEEIGPAPTLADTAAKLAADFNIPGPAWVVSTACSSGLTALIDAAVALRSGHAGPILVIAAELATDFVRQGFAALKATSPSNACRPFDQHRDGLLLASAAAACIVAPWTPHAFAEIRSFGLANDATHMTAPDRQGRGLIRAIHAALASANLPVTALDALLLHGTGTRYNDAMEAVAIDTLFGKTPPPITALKGLIGHTLGTSGLLETLLAAQALRSQLLPPIVGLREPERPDLPLLRSPHRGPMRTLLKTASGFGGLNAALLLATGAPHA